MKLYSYNAYEAVLFHERCNFFCICEKNRHESWKSCFFFVILQSVLPIVLAMPQEQSGIRERQRTDLREPRKYKVIIYNDDFTTMEFVVKVLVQVFFKSAPEAEALMLQVHRSEKAVVGIYTYDVAQSKVRMATSMAREEGFPLRLTCEED